MVKARSVSADEREPLLREMTIEGEGLDATPPAHRHERHGVDETQMPPAPTEQQIETGVVERLVHPEQFRIS